MAKVLLINVLKYIQGMNLVFSAKDIWKATGASDCTINHALKTIRKMYPDMLEVRADIRPRLYIRKMSFSNDMVLRVDQACKEYYRNYKRPDNPRLRKSDVQKWISEVNRVTLKEAQKKDEEYDTSNLSSFLSCLAQVIKNGSDKPVRLYGALKVNQETNVDFDIMVEASKKE